MPVALIPVTVGVSVIPLVPSVPVVITELSADAKPKLGSASAGSKNVCLSVLAAPGPLTGMRPEVYLGISNYYCLAVSRILRMSSIVPFSVPKTRNSSSVSITIFPSIKERVSSTGTLILEAIATEP